MSDVRCPMCSALNPEDIEICTSCSARLKPLIADQPSPEGPSDWEEKPEPTGEEEPEEDDWLRRVRAEAESELPDEEVPEDAPEDAEAPDWLGRLREAEIPGEEGPPEGEIPDWLSAFAEEAGAEGEPAEAPEPDWLERIRDQEALEAEEEVERPQDPEDQPESHQKYSSFTISVFSTLGIADCRAKITTRSSGRMTSFPPGIITS